MMGVAFFWEWVKVAWGYLEGVMTWKTCTSLDWWNVRRNGEEGANHCSLFVSGRVGVGGGCWCGGDPRVTFHLTSTCLLTKGKERRGRKDW